MRDYRKRMLAVFLVVLLSALPSVRIFAGQEEIPSGSGTAETAPAPSGENIQGGEGETPPEPEATSSPEGTSAKEPEATSSPEESSAKEPESASSPEESSAKEPESASSPEESSAKDPEDVSHKESEKLKEPDHDPEDTSSQKPPASEETSGEDPEQDSSGEAEPVFSAAESSAEERGGKYFVTIVARNADFDQLYIGSRDDGDKDPVIRGQVNGQGTYTFTFEVLSGQLGQRIPVVPRSAETGEWYTETDVFLALPALTNGSGSGEEEAEPEEDSQEKEEDVLFLTETEAEERELEAAEGDTLEAEETGDPLFLNEQPEELPQQAEDSGMQTEEGTDPASEEVPMTGAAAVSDGTYRVQTELVTGTMFNVVACTLTVKNGSMNAVITLNGKGYDYLYMGSREEALSAPLADCIPYAEDSSGRYTYTMPVAALDEPIAFSCRSARYAALGDTENMWYDRALVFQSAGMEKISDADIPQPGPAVPAVTPTPAAPQTGVLDGITQPVDNTTTLADGTYKPKKFTYSGGTGKVTLSCQKVTVKKGKAYATIVFSSEKFPYVKAGGNIYDNPVLKNGTASFRIPVALGKKNTIIGMTTAMSEPHEIIYEIKVTVAKPSDGAVKAGTYQIRVDSSAEMFRVIDCVLTVKDGGMTARITLSGVGYDYLYMGTKEQAVKAKKSRWIPVKETVRNLAGSDGKTQDRNVYEIPVSALDVPVAVAARSRRDAETGKEQPWYDRELTFRSATLKAVTDGGDPVGSGGDGSSGGSSSGGSGSGGSAGGGNEYPANTGGSTSAVNSSTGLKDGTYKPDSFSWSGGTGRTSLSCSRVTVKNGRTWATIVFNSDKYQYVKAGGSTYYGTSSGGSSSFEIPVTLNANNRILGMTTAMSQPHEIEYTIYVGLKAAKAASGGGSSSGGGAQEGDAADEAADDSESGSLEQLSDAPEIAGLEYEGSLKTGHAEYFRLHCYSGGFKALEIDVSRDTAEVVKQKEPEEAAREALAAEDEEDPSDAAETASRYDKEILTYLIAPENGELPAGIDKEMIVIQLPVEHSYVASGNARKILEKLGADDRVAVEDTGEEGVQPEFRTLVEKKSDLAIVSSEILPHEEDGDPQAKAGAMRELGDQFALLGIPMIVDRSADEKKDSGKYEWCMVYGALFGEEEKAEKLCEDAVMALEEKE